MKQLAILMVLALLITAIVVDSCKKPVSTNNTDNSNYPPEVAAIILNECAISGCHDAASYANSDNLRLDTWEHLFQGGSDGASVIPYCTLYSPFLSYINTDSLQGPVNYPTMPISTPGRNLAYLTRAQYNTIYNWIAAGAPDKNGNVAFAANPDTRQKIYITQQGCDIVAVVDAESKLVMRYISVGMPQGVINPSQSPHDVTMSDDGMYGYVSLFNGTYLQKFDTRADTVIAQDNLSNQVPGGSVGWWSIIDVSPQDTALVVSSYLSDGFMAYLNPQTMATVYNTGSGSIPNAHGIENNTTFDTFFVCSQFGNVVYKFSRNGFPEYLKQVNIDPQLAITTSTVPGVTPDPHQIMMSPDHSRYYVSCENTNEVRVMDAHTDTLIAVIPVGAFPQELDMSSTYPYLFVACMHDANNPNAGRLGSVYVINYNTNQVITVLYGDFYEPHDVTVDEMYGQLFVISTNANGVAHHTTACGGTSGWYSVYDLNDLQPADNNRYTMTNFSYASAARF